MVVQGTARYRAVSALSSTSSTLLFIALLFCGTRRAVAAGDDFPYDVAQAGCIAWANLRNYAPQRRQGCNYYMTAGSWTGCRAMCAQRYTDGSVWPCRGGCGNFHNQPCWATGFSTDSAFVPLTISGQYDDHGAGSSTDIWSNKCTAMSDNTTRTVAIAGDCGKSTTTSLEDCDAGGSTTIVVYAFGFGCTLSTPRPTITIGTTQLEALALECTNVTAPTVVPDPGCSTSKVLPQALACTIPSVPSNLLGVPLNVYVVWVQNTTVNYLSEFSGAAHGSVVVPSTATAISKVNVTFTCLHRMCDPEGTPRIVYIEGCDGDLNEDPTLMFTSYRRARNCIREGGTRITIHGFFLSTATITVNGAPCRDVQFDPVAPEEQVTCIIPCPAEDRSEWIPDPLRRANVDRRHTTSNGWHTFCWANMFLDGVYGAWEFSQIDNPSGSWCASINDGSRYLQLDLGSVQLVGGVVTQGHVNRPEWTTGFAIEIAGTNEMFSVHEEFGAHIGLRPVNTDQNTKVNSAFAKPVYARYVRVVPKTWVGDASSLRADILLGAQAGGIMGSTHTHHVVACTTHGCSRKAENTRITYRKVYDPTQPHLCYHAPLIESATVIGGSLRITGRGFGAGAPTSLEGKTPLRFRYAVGNDATCNLMEAGRVTWWSQTRMEISLRHENSSFTAAPTSAPTSAPTMHSMPANVWGRYTAESWNESASATMQWNDISGNNRHVTKFRGKPTLIRSSGAVSYLNGGVSDGLRFPAGSIPSAFTIFVVARYRTYGTKKRIFGSVGENWLHGFWSGKSGVAHYNAWKTAQTDRANGDAWIKIGGRNNGTQMILVDGVNRATVAGGAGGDILTINDGYGPTERSDWQVREVVIFDRSLSDDEMLVVNSLVGTDVSTVGTPGPQNKLAPPLPCAEALDAVYADSLSSAPLLLSLQLGGSSVGCFPRSSPCVLSISGCASVATGDIASTGSCIVEGGLPITVRGRNLSPTLLWVQSDAIASSMVKAEPTTAALDITSFTAGASDPTLPFGTASDTLVIVLPCLYPQSLWGSSISLVSGDASTMRSIPTLTYKIDYDAKIPYLCYINPVVVTIEPRVAEPGQAITLNGHNFGALAPHLSPALFGTLTSSAYGVRLGHLAPCDRFTDEMWTATSIKFTMCEGDGENLPLVVTLGAKNSTKDTVAISYFECAAGERATRGNISACESCPNGRYGQSKRGGSTTCTDCGIGYAAESRGATDCVACEGDTATGVNFTASSCTPCLAGEIADKVHATCSMCAEGSYRSKQEGTVDSTCTQCPAKGVRCVGGVLKIDVGTWFPLDTTLLAAETEIHRCFNNECCEYDDSRSALSCNEELGYSGPLCGVCGEGFVRSGTKCRECFDNWLNIVFFIGIAIATIVVLAFLAVEYKFSVPMNQHEVVVQKIGFSHLQMLGVLGIFKAKGTEVYVFPPLSLSLSLRLHSRSNLHKLCLPRTCSSGITT